jgi:hypothetical protein
MALPASNALAAAAMKTVLFMFTPHFLLSPRFTN